MTDCRWHRCRRPLEAIRASRRFCSVRCRVAHHRAGRYAQQLRACRVELIGRVEASSIIIEHEHLGTLGNSELFFGCARRMTACSGVIGFGNGAHAAGAACDAVLEQGWTSARAPRNSESHLIGRVLRYGRRYLGWKTVRAFSDPRFAEEGQLYRAVGFRQIRTRHPNRFRWGMIRRSCAQRSRDLPTPRWPRRRAGRRCEARSVAAAGGLGVARAGRHFTTRFHPHSRGPGHTAQIPN
jgi:hypothetical protein